MLMRVHTTSVQIWYARTSTMWRCFTKTRLRTPPRRDKNLSCAIWER